MPIEFRCAGCQKLLRTPDDSAGKKARCPDCGSIVDVPSSSSPSSGAAPSEPASAGPVGGPPSGSPFGAPAPSSENPFADREHSAAPRTEPTRPAYDGGNPYAAPGMTPEPQLGFAAGGQLVHNRVSVEQLLSETWNFVKSNLGMALLFGLIPLAGNVAGSIVTNVITTAANVTRDNTVIILSQVVAQLISMFVQVFIQTGTAVAVLHWMRSGNVDVSKFFQVGPYFARALGVTFLILLFFAFLFALTIGPGAVVLAQGHQEEGLIAMVIGLVVATPVSIWIGMQFYLATMFLVDRQAGVLESMRMSKQYMNGNRMTVFLAMIIIGVASIPVICLTCGMGSLVAVPFYAVANAIVYLLATGQPYFRPQQMPTPMSPASWTPPPPPSNPPPPVI